MHVPDCDDGFMPVANTFIPILMDLPIRREAKFVLAEAVAQCWGRSKLKAATINLRTIAVRWGFPRVDNVKRGAVQLKELGCLEVVAENGNEWTVKIDKRAMVAMLPREVQEGLESYGEAASKIHAGPNDRGDKKRNASKSASLPTEALSGGNSLQKTDEVGGNDAPNGGEVPPMGVKNGTPYNPLKEEYEYKDEYKESVSPGQTNSDGNLPGKEVPTPEVLDAIRILIEARVDPCQNNGDLWKQVKKHQRVFKSDWMLKAVKRAFLKDSRANRLPKWNYVLAILRDWIPDGEPNAGPEDAYADDLSLRPVSASAPPIQSIPMTSMLSPANQRRAAMQADAMRLHAEAQRQKAIREAAERQEAHCASA